MPHEALKINYEHISLTKQKFSKHYSQIKTQGEKKITIDGKKKKNKKKNKTKKKHTQKSQTTVQ